MTRIEVNTIKFFLILLIIAITLINNAVAQSQYSQPGMYKGLQASFGYRALNIRSNIAEVTDMNAGFGGSQIGILFGSDILRINLGLFGYYFSTGDMIGSIDLYTNNMGANFYPLSAFRGKKDILSPYISVGANLDRMKFYGHYLQSPDTKINYSISQEPYLGKITQLNSFFGLGIDARLMQESGQFVHLFTELKYGAKMASQASDQTYTGTHSTRQVALNIGLRFGSN
jgi:hypothetical protein